MSIQVKNFKLRCEVLRNEAYRRVVYTGHQLQIVVMCLLPGEDLEFQNCPNTSQIYRIEEGAAKASVDKKHYRLEAQDVLIVPPGLCRTLENDSDEVVRLYSVFSGDPIYPANLYQYEKPV